MGSMLHNLLIIDDDIKLVQLVREYLQPQGFTLDAEHDGEAGLRRLQHLEKDQDYDLVILDLMLPGIDGLEVCRRLRRRNDVPVLMLTARGDETDRIVGLEIGADDYLPKPFNPRELLARIRAILRRSTDTDHSDADTGAETSLLVGPLEIEPGTRQATLSDRPIELTTAEFDILYTLARSAGRVLSRDQLLQEIHGPGWAAYSRSIDVHISRIRAKIENDPKHPQILKTVRGIGYQLSRPLKP